MKTILHKADSRGHADHGWLNTYHTFSFADYYDPGRMGFGALRVLNDDTVSAGMGFGKHPHRDMEIVSIPLEGVLQHGDNMGHEGVIRRGEIQVMSAGTGVIHSEKNASDEQPVKFLQIWIFPKSAGLPPRYDQMSVAEHEKKNDFQQILSPNRDDDGVWIHQDAWFHLAEFDKGIARTYALKKQGNGVYVFVIEGKARVGEQVLEKRDGYGIYDTGAFTLEALEDAEILVMEVPMAEEEYG
ncbi:MAG TPA: pirin family protein [Edaphocola sp.]|nr:pirin family protein [Edaphocola sp.]